MENVPMKAKKTAELRDKLENQHKVKLTTQMQTVLAALAAGEHPADLVLVAPAAGAHVPPADPEPAAPAAPAAPVAPAAPEPAVRPKRKLAELLRSRIPKP